MTKLLTAEIARSLLDYDVETGIVTRRRVFGRRHAGDPVGSLNAKGYLHAYIYDTNYLVHRVVWLMVCDRWPYDQLDHVNHIRDDNRLENLRECTNAENRQNIRPEGYGQSGYLGVSPCHDGWQANITLKGKNERLGIYSTPEEASRVYLAAKASVHAFATHGVSELGDAR